MNFEVAQSFDLNYSNLIDLETKKRLQREAIILEVGALEEAQALVAPLFVKHQLHGLSKNGLRPIQLSRKEFQNISLCMFDYGCEVRIEPEVFEQDYFVMVPLSGNISIQTENAENTIAVGQMGIMSAERKYKMHWSHDCVCFIMQIKKTAFIQWGETQLGKTSVSAPLFELTARPIEGELRASLHMAQALLALLEEEAENTHTMAIQIENCMVGALLRAFPNNVSNLLGGCVTSTACPKNVKLALDYIHQNLSDPITIDDLVRASGSPARTLLEGFKRFRGTTPIRYIKTARLLACREALLESISTQTVSEIASAYGFTHLGRFAGEYQQKFGETPSETLKRAQNRAA